jgi:hypothetical protein
MEQKDYLLREVEKIGVALCSILNGFFGDKENLAIKISNKFEQTNEKLLNEIGFDLNHFISIDESAFSDYISKFNGINTTNLELLAELIFQIGINEKSDKKNILLNKALQVLELCNKTDKTYSFERANKIERIKKSI